MKNIHPIQQKILALSDRYNLGQLTLRKIGEMIDVPDRPQLIKHHIQQLGKDGFIKIDKKRNIIQKITENISNNQDLIDLPILGSANCGEATMLADEYIQGYLKISKKLLNTGSLSRFKNIFIIQASGNSMNKASIDNKNIEDGDYIVVDGANKIPSNGDYILSIINGMANVKKFIRDEKNQQIILISESTHDFPPIYIHKSDIDNYLINGKVIQVIKKPKGN